MESKPDPSETSALLADAEASRARLVDAIELPSLFYSSIGVSIAVQIASTSLAIGLGSTDPMSSASWLLPAGLVLFVVVVAIQLARFRRLNGLWLDGLAHRVVGGTAAAASTPYVIALGAGIWAAFGALWWLVAVSAVAGGVAYAVAGRRWMRNYRIDPTDHGQPYSRGWLAVAGLVAFAGLVILAIGH